MNIKDYIAYAKKVLNEDAGSEGMMYTVKALSGLKNYEDGTVTIDDVKAVNGEQSARVRFSFPHDWGYASKVVKQVLGDIDIISLELVY